MTRTEVSQLDVALEDDLHRAVDTQELLLLLRHRAGLTQDTIASATGASLRSVRNWEHHAVRLRQRNDDRLRYLAEIVATLATTLTPRGIAQWLHARNRALSNRRPLDLLPTDTTDKVLTAALTLTGGTLV